MAKRITRDPDNGMICGVAAGIADHIDVDPVLVRLAWIIGTLLTGLVPGTIAYLLAWLVVPMEPARLPAAPPATESPPAG